MAGMGRRYQLNNQEKTMRRKDREIIEVSEILEVIKKCTVCRLAFFDEGYPYIVPLNFGFETDGGKLTLWFHCAGAGKKLELLRQNSHVAFELDCPGRIIEGAEACDYTMTFESVCGTGTLEIANETDKLPALRLLMRQYSERTDFEFDTALVGAVTILKMTVNKVTGKRLVR
jgi:nitroimidazol reductase NimA-like FMN-containing flavoprotein (pyridoxamine 5'-phosphate oxidase superfamily)